MELIFTSNIRKFRVLPAFLVVITLLFSSCEKKVFTHPEKKQKTEADYLKESMVETEEMFNRLDKAKANRDNKNKKEIFIASINSNIISENKILSQKAMKLKNNKEYKKAIKILLYIYRDEPKNISVLESITDLYSLLKDYTNAKNYAQKILDIEKNNIFALTVFANYYANNNQVNKAIDTYLELIKINSNYILLYNVAVLYEKQGKLRKAFEFYKKSLRKEESVESFYALALISKKLRNNSDVILYLKKAVSKGASIKIKRYLASEYLSQAKYKEAIFIYEELANKSNSVFDYMDLGNAYNQIQNYTKAESIYLKALRVSPKNSDLLYNIAICYYRMNSPIKMNKIIEQYEANSSSVTKIRQLKVYLAKISK